MNMLGMTPLGTSPETKISAAGHWICTRHDSQAHYAVSLSTQDLRDRLWDICEARKEEAEQERLDIINESWLQDSVGIIMNHFFSLMQVGAARHSDTDSLCSLIPHGTTPLGMSGVCSETILLLTPCVVWSSAW